MMMMWIIDTSFKRRGVSIANLKNDLVIVRGKGRVIWAGQNFRFVFAFGLHVRMIPESILWRKDQGQQAQQAHVPSVEQI